MAAVAAENPRPEKDFNAIEFNSVGFDFYSQFFLRHKVLERFYFAKMSLEDLQCFNKQSRDFLVSVAVHKARNLSALNANTFVVVNFDGDTKKTKVFDHSDCPFFNEVCKGVNYETVAGIEYANIFQYFTFEIKTALVELLKKNVRISVIQDSHFLKRNVVIGEVNVNLTTIWNQQCEFVIKPVNHFSMTLRSDHAFIKQWAVLEKIGEDDKQKGSVGYLQLDLSIVVPTEAPAPAMLHTYDDDIVEA